MKVGFVSLGCAKNLVDTEVMLGLLEKNNFEIIDRPEDADILIVNTCSFIDTAKEESISVILQMAEFKKRGNCKCLVVAGCLGQRYKEELLDELPEVDAILGTGAWNRIIDAISMVFEGRRVIMAGAAETIYDESAPRVITTQSHTAYVKIAEGCDNRCSYCVIPRVRGDYRSRPIESVLAEVRNLAARGVKEINLIAQDTTRYGQDLYGEVRLVPLLRLLASIEDITWIRLLYCYPDGFNDELISIIANEPKICKYIDLPLQHAHDDILKEMRRRGSRKEVEKLLAKLRSDIPGVAIRTTFIVGFPGETEEHFNSLYEFVEQQSFDHVGVFPYSPEEDTVAFDMPNRVPEDIKQDRYHRLMALQCQISERINQSLEGKSFEVVIEGFTDQPNVAFGRSYREAPGVDGQIFVEDSDAVQPGEFIRARIVQGFTYDLLAEKI